MTHLAGGLLALAAVLVCIARHTAGKPPLWRSKVAFVGSVLCLIAGGVLVAVDPAAVDGVLRRAEALAVAGLLTPEILGWFRGPVDRVH